MPQAQTAPAIRRPWNSGRIIGPKPPLKPKYIWGCCQSNSNSSPQDGLRSKRHTGFSMTDRHSEKASERLCL